MINYHESVYNIPVARGYIRPFLGSNTQIELLMIAYAQA